MKYWAVPNYPPKDPNESDEILFTTLSSIRSYLKEHTDIEGAYLYHWYCGDLAESVWYSREEILKKKSSPMKGATAQWEVSHQKS